MAWSAVNAWAALAGGRGQLSSPMPSALPHIGGRLFAEDMSILGAGVDGVVGMLPLHSKNTGAAHGLMSRRIERPIFLAGVDGAVFRDTGGYCGNEVCTPIGTIYTAGF